MDTREKQGPGEDLDDSPPPGCRRRQQLRQREVQQDSRRERQHQGRARRKAPLQEGSGYQRSARQDSDTPRDKRRVSGRKREQGRHHPLRQHMKDQAETHASADVGTRLEGSRQHLAVEERAKPEATDRGTRRSYTRCVMIVIVAVRQVMRVGMAVGVILCVIMVVSGRQGGRSRTRLRHEAIGPGLQRGPEQAIEDEYGKDSHGYGQKDPVQVGSGALEGLRQQVEEREGHQIAAA